MWKKSLWVYLGLYAIAVLAVLVNYVVKNTGSDDFLWASCLIYLVLFLPPTLATLELRGRKAPIWLALVSLLILAVPVVAILKFNEMSLATVGKVILFAPMIPALCFFCGRRLFIKKGPAPIP